MKSFFTTILLAVAVLAAPLAQAQPACAASNPDHFAAVLTGSNAVGWADFVIDRERDLVSYRIDASRLSGVTGARIQRASGADAVDLIANDQYFLKGVLEGTVSPAGSLVDEIYSNPSAFSVRVTSASGSMRGRLNGRGTVLMAGTLATAGGSSVKVRPDVAANATGVFSIGFVDDDPSANDVRVDFDVMTDSIDGMDTTSLVLVAGDSTSDILDLVTAAGLVDGRLHGSVRLSRDELARIIANPSGYHLQFRSNNDGLFSGEMGEAVTTFIPAFGRTQNAYGNHFSSDLRLYNPGNEPANVFIQFFPAGATEPLAGNVAVIRLEPNQSRVIGDAVPALFGSTAGMGSLRIVSSAQVVADSEILDDVPSGNRVGSNSHNAPMGQFVSGLGACNSVTHGLLTSLAANQSFRTNVIVGNPGTRAAVAHFELRDEQGRLLDSRTMTLPAHGQMLLPLTGANGLFHNAGGNLRNVTLTMHADTPLFLGSSLVENGTGEARFNAARDIGHRVKTQ